MHFFSKIESALKKQLLLNFAYHVTAFILKLFCDSSFILLFFVVVRSIGLTVFHLPWSILLFHRPQNKDKKYTNDNNKNKKGLNSECRTSFCHAASTATFKWYTPLSLRRRCPCHLSIHHQRAIWGANTVVSVVSCKIVLLDCENKTKKQKRTGNLRLCHVL